MAEEVKVKFTGNTSSLDKSIKGVGKRLKMLSGLAVGFAAIKGVMALSRGLISAVDSAIAFSRGMAEVNTIAKLSRKDLSALKGEARALSATLGLELTDVVKGLYQALSAGVPANNVISFMQVAGKAAIAGVTEVETAVDGLTSVLNAYGLKTTDATRVSDIFFETIRLGKTTFPELSESIGQVVPIANSMGVSFKEVAAAIATMTKSGIKTTEAVTQLKGLMTAMLKPTDAMEKAMKGLNDKFGASAFASFSFQKKLKLLADSVNNDQKAITELIPKVRGLNGMFVLTGENAKEASNDLRKIGNSTGAMKKAFSTMANDVSTSINKMKASFDSLKIALSTKLMPYIKTFSVAMKEAFNLIEDALTGALVSDPTGRKRIMEDLQKQVKEVYGIIPKTLQQEFEVAINPNISNEQFKELTGRIRDGIEGGKNIKSNKSEKDAKAEAQSDLLANNRRKAAEKAKKDAQDLADAEKKANDKIALDAEKAADKQRMLESKMIEDLQHRIEMQKLINAGKEDEAKLAQMVYDWQKKTGEELDENSDIMNQFKEIIALDKEADKEKTDLSKTDSSVGTTALERMGAIFGTSQKEDKKELKGIEKFTSKTSKTLEKILEKENNVSLGAV